MAKRFHVGRRIAASPERVWSLLTDASSYPDWNPSIANIEGDMSMGSKVRLVSKVNPKRTFTLTATVGEPPNAMVWSDGMPFGLFTGERTFRLSAAERGTNFSMTEEFRGPLSGLITKAIPDMTDSFDHYADGLKAAAEQGGA